MSQRSSTHRKSNPADFGGSYWRDVTSPATRTKRGANEKPDYDEINIGFLFPQNKTNEKIHINEQMNHDWELGTNIKPHIHFIQTSALLPIFKMVYKWYNNGDIVGYATLFATLTTTGVPVFPYVSGNLPQILEFPEIDGSKIDTHSSLLDIVVYRDDNIVSGDVLFKSFDFHAKFNKIGTLNEYY
ncbi:MAG: hypothetical protein GY870_14970 [archaeon]|nr:hypothetical protein [archaeon]